MLVKQASVASACRINARTDGGERAFLRVCVTIRLQRAGFPRLGAFKYGELSSRRTVAFVSPNSVPHSYCCVLCLNDFAG